MAGGTLTLWVTPVGPPQTPPTHHHHHHHHHRTVKVCFGLVVGIKNLKPIS